MAQTVRSLPALQETQVQSLSQEHPLEKGMATHSSILAWRIPWREDPSLWDQRVRHAYVTNTFLGSFTPCNLSNLSCCDFKSSRWYTQRCLFFSSKNLSWDFPGGAVDKESACQCRGSVADLGSSHKPQSCWARGPQLLSPRAATPENCAPRACALKPEKPLQREANSLQQRVAPTHCN